MDRHSRPRHLTELRDAFRHVDNDEHVLRFQPPEVVIDAAECAGLRVLDSDRDTLHAWAPDLRSLLTDIKTLGAHQTGAPPPRAPGKTAWARLSAAYEPTAGPTDYPRPTTPSGSSPKDLKT